MIEVRPARPEEAEALTRLCLRSKAHWGYDAAFMERCAATLRVTPAMIEEGRVLVAASGGEAVGVASFAAIEPAGSFDLDLLFVEPSAIGMGVGRLLFAAVVEQLEARDATRMTILADPYAAPFYERLGARRIGDAPSDAVPGRSLPLFEFRLAAR